MELYDPTYAVSPVAARAELAALVRSIEAWFRVYVRVAIAPVAAAAGAGAAVRHTAVAAPTEGALTGMLRRGDAARRVPALLGLLPVPDPDRAVLLVLPARAVAASSAVPSTAAVVVATSAAAAPAAVAPRVASLLVGGAVPLPGATCRDALAAAAAPLRQGDVEAAAVTVVRELRRALALRRAASLLAWAVLAALVAYEVARVLRNRWLWREGRERRRVTPEPGASCPICLGGAEEGPPPQSPLQSPLLSPHSGQPVTPTTAEWEKFSCGHVFHRACAVRWLQRNNACPVCRREDPTHVGVPWPSAFLFLANVAPTLLVRANLDLVLPAMLGGVQPRPLLIQMRF